MRCFAALATCVCCFAAAPRSLAAAPLTAVDIVTRGRAAGGIYMMGFDAGASQIAIVLEDDKGNRRTTRVQSRVRTNAAGERESLLTILDPPDIRGVTVLAHEHENGEDDTWLYLPAFKRTRRIAGNDKNGQFMGTDFSYVDMEEQEVDDARYELLPDAAVDGVTCYALAVVPLDRSMYSKQYSRVEMWIRQDNFLAQQMKYYDHKGRLMKTYHLHKTRLLNGKPVVAEAQVRTERTGHSTYIIVESVEPGTQFPAEQFQPEALGR